MLKKKGVFEILDNSPSIKLLRSRNCSVILKFLTSTFDESRVVLYENICITELNIDKKQKNGRDIKDDLKTLQDLMTSLQIKPSQTNSNALTEAKTFGQLIEKWEDEWDGGKPIPEPDPDFADIDKIGTLIDVFYKGHLAKMMGLKNGFTNSSSMSIQFLKRGFAI